MTRCTFTHRVVGAALLVCVMGWAEAQSIRFRLTTREVVESRLREYGGSNRERGARLKRMFVDAGCSEHVSEQFVRLSIPPNVICTLPGTSGRVIIVGAHFDRTLEGDGVADNWSGASLLPSLYEAVKVEPRKHTYVFIGFTEEEKGLIGSNYYARKLTREQVAATDAMVNLDTLGLAPSNVWTSHSDEKLILALAGVAKHLKLPLSGLNFERIGSTDSESFAARRIPRLTIHSLTQKTENDQILHTRKDKLSVVKMDDLYDSYHLVTVYLVYLDYFFDRLEAAETPAN